MRLPLAPAAALALAVIAGTVPVAGQSLAAGDQEVYAEPGFVRVEVTYSDGVASTKMGFVQHEGQNGGPDERLEPGMRCTEWFGTFTQVLVEARASDAADTVDLDISGFLAAPGEPTERHIDEPGFVLDALGTPGAFEGRLLVCDAREPDHDGELIFSGELAGPLEQPDHRGLVRLTMEGSP